MPFTFATCVILRWPCIPQNVAAGSEGGLLLVAVAIGNHANCWKESRTFSMLPPTVPPVCDCSSQSISSKKYLNQFIFTYIFFNVIFLFYSLLPN